MEEPAWYDLNARRELPRIIEVDTGVLPESWRDICKRNHVRPHAVVGYENKVDNIKIWPASNIIARGIARGEHFKTDAITESSSGNFVLSLAEVVRQMQEHDPEFPIKRVVAVVSKKLQPDKLAKLEKEPLIELVYVDDAADAMRKAETLAEEHGYWYTRQYWNTENSDAYEHIGIEIARALPDLGVLSIGVGSGGTFSGIVPPIRAAFVNRETPKELHCTAVAVAPGDSVGGVRTEIGLQLNGKPGLPWRPLADDVTYVDLETSLKMSAALWKQCPDNPEKQIVAGESTGFALAGGLLSILQLEATDRLDALRNEKGDITMAFIAPDRREPYRADYEKYGIQLP